MTPKTTLIVTAASSFAAGAIIATLATPRAGEATSPPIEAHAHTESATPSAPASHHQPLPPRAEPTRIDALLVGGGPSPESNQLSIQEDLALASELYAADRTRILFGAGNASASVQVLDEERRGSEVEQILSDFFDSRGGREAHYVMPTLASNGPATRGNVLSSITNAVARASTTPVDLIFIGHGEAGDTPLDSAFDVWGNERIRTKDIADAIIRGARPLRLIATSCFSGGFGALAVFKPLSESPMRARACGLFASTPDREASGCDPDPERANHVGFSITFFNALRKKNRDGTALPDDAVDFDHDGRVSYAEAHAYTIIHSESIDVPTRTSEVILYNAELNSPAARDVALPEVDAIITQLGAKIDCADEQTATDALTQITQTRERIEHELEGLEEQEAQAYRRAVGDLLARFPTLDDPWHPDYAPTVRAHEQDILAFFDDNPNHAAWVSLSERVQNLSEQLSALQVTEAPYMRLLHAYAYRRYAPRLHARGGADWELFQAVRACESGSPGQD